MLDNNEEWELAPGNAHPRARQLLTESYFWNCADDDSPLGNDTGADTLWSYRAWRANHPLESSQTFIDGTLAGWEVKDVDWLLFDERLLQQALDEDHFSILTSDDFMIGLAFAQLVLEGKIDAPVRERALHSTRRQATGAVISFREWIDPEERRERLSQMQRILEIV